MTGAPVKPWLGSIMAIAKMLGIHSMSCCRGIGRICGREVCGKAWSSPSGHTTRTTFAGLALSRERAPQRLLWLRRPVERRRFARDQANRQRSFLQG